MPLLYYDCSGSGQHYLALREVRLTELRVSRLAVEQLDTWSSMEATYSKWTNCEGYKDHGPYLHPSSLC